MNGDASKPEVLGLLLMGMVVVGTLLSLITLVRAIRKEGSWFGGLTRLCPSRPRVGPFWTPIEAIMLVLGHQLLLGVVALFFACYLMVWPTRSLNRLFPTMGAEWAIPPDPLTGAVGIGIASLAMIPIAVWYLHLRHRDAADAVGLRFRRADVSVALRWVGLLLPPVLLVSSVVNLLVTYRHDALTALGMLDDPLAIAVLVFSVGVVTPVAEELLFRGVLQGSLEYVLSVRHQMRTTGVSLAEAAARPVGRTHVWRPTSVWPIVWTSVIFALLHLGQGGAVVPLFLFSLGLGWVMRQTGSLLPSILLHATLNLFSLAVAIAAPTMTDGEGPVPVRVDADPTTEVTPRSSAHSAAPPALDPAAG